MDPETPLLVAAHMSLTTSTLLASEPPRKNTEKLCRSLPSLGNHQALPIVVGNDKKHLDEARNTSRRNLQAKNAMRSSHEDPTDTSSQITHCSQRTHKGHTSRTFEVRTDLHTPLLLPPDLHPSPAQFTSSGLCKILSSLDANSVATVLHVLFYSKGFAQYKGQRKRERKHHVYFVCGKKKTHLTTEEERIGWYKLDKCHHHARPRTRERKAILSEKESHKDRARSIKPYMNTFAWAKQRHDVPHKRRSDHT